MSIPVHVIGGYLGVGKTTAMVAILAMLPNERVAVVVNDFGTSSLDELTLQGKGANVGTVREIRGGCVCCTAPEGFVGAVASLLDDPTIDRILVEPTGLARPADLIDTLRRAPYADQLSLRPLVVLVDPEVLLAETDGQVSDQAQVADILVANRVDLASPASLAHFSSWAQNLWPKPMLTLHATHGNLPKDVLDWAEGQGPRAVRHQHHHRHDQDHGVTSMVWGPASVFSRGRLRVLLSRPGHGIARIKGVFRTDEGWSRMEHSGGELHERTTGYRRDTRVDVIARGAESAERQAVFRAQFQEALLREDELQQAADALEVALPNGDNRRFDRASLLALPDGIDDVSDRLPGREGAAVTLAALLKAAGAPHEGNAVVVAADGFTTEPVALADLQQALLLHSLDGAPLPNKKGGPYRLMIPGDAGPGGPCANVKAVVRISVR